MGFFFSFQFAVDEEYNVPSLQNSLNYLMQKGLVLCYPFVSF